MKKIVLSNAKDFTFSSATRLFNFRTAVVFGVCRSGKTSLGTLIGSCKFVDNIEEPWTAKIITLMSGLKMMPKKLSKEVLLNFITESYNDTVLFRNQSFKPSDMSSIWNQKEKDEIDYRLTRLETRQDAQNYIKKNDPLFLINLTEVQPFTNLLTETLKNIKLIHVVRNGYEVASDCLKKRWFSDKQLQNPIKALPYKLYTLNKKLYHIPWWVGKDEEELFIKYNEFERCIYYWCQTIELTVKKFDNINVEKNNKVIKYSDLLSKTREIFLETCNYLDISPTKKSFELVNKISFRTSNQFFKKKINDSLKKRIKYLNDEYEL